MKIKFMTQNWGEVSEVCLDLKKEWGKIMIMNKKKRKTHTQLENSM